MAVAEAPAAVRARRYFAAAALTVAALAVGSPPAQAKSYHFPYVRIDATIHPDGSLELRERRTFDFDGDFSFAFFTIDPTHASFFSIEDFSITESGVPVPFTTGFASHGGFEARWEFSASDERRTWDISYRVLCAVDVYEDAAHLLWQFVGTGWTERTDRVEVTVHVPGRADRPVERPPACGAFVDAPPAPRMTEPLAPGEVRAWGHGPLGGEVTIVDPQTVRLEVSDLQPATFVEGSILMPADVVPTMALEPGGAGRARIMAEEAAMARAANEARRTYLRNRGATRWLFAGIPLVLALAVAISKVRDRVPGVPRTLQEPPEDIHPVELAYLWDAARGRYLPRHAYRTQILHLARIGAIELRAVGRVTDPDEVRVALRRTPKTGFDKEFVEFLFPRDEREVSLDDLDATGRRRKPLKAWGDSVRKKTQAGVDRIRRSGPRIESVVSVLVLLGAIGWWVVAEYARGLAALAAALAFVGLIVALRLITPRIPAGERERIARWAAFRRFLRTFSTLDEAPVLAVVVWERYLVLATALGVADEVERQVREIVPPEQLPSPWRGAPPGAAGYGLVHGFRTTAPRYAPSAVSASSGSGGFSSGVGSFSSSGGGGGGFSGGGGGGGGGTGGGAG